MTQKNSKGRKWTFLKKRDYAWKKHSYSVITSRIRHFKNKKTCLLRLFKQKHPKNGVFHFKTVILSCPRNKNDVFLGYQKTAKNSPFKNTCFYVLYASNKKRGKNSLSRASYKKSEKKIQVSEDGWCTNGCRSVYRYKSSDI